MLTRKQSRLSSRAVAKSPTGIVGLDQITEGGFPKGRPTLICGSAGCGKTMLAVEFLVRGATQFNEPGVFLSFEETDKELAQNVASMGFDLSNLCARKKLWLEYVRVDRSQIAESGSYNLDALFIRLGAAIDAVGAKRVALDTLENLFCGFSDTQILRAELRRLFTWLKSKGVTAVVTAESGKGRLTRDDIEEYVADCVIFLDHRVEQESSVRRLRIVKYRGTPHGTSEYPFLIGRSGFSVMPLSTLTLNYAAPLTRLSSGIQRLDTMLDGKGFYRGTSVLLSGVAGTGKSSLAAHFVLAACQRGERALYIASEESPAEVIRNMRSIGIDLGPWVKRGLLRFYATQPGSLGLESYLVAVDEVARTFKPRVVVVDPVTNFTSSGSRLEVKSMVTRLIDMFKSRLITALFTSLTSGDSAPEVTELGIASQMDTWLQLRNLESNGERNRGLCVSKSRGMAHSNQIREFVLSKHGLELLNVYVGSSGLVTGSARVILEARERAIEVERKRELRSKAINLKQKHQQVEASIAKLRYDFDLEEQSLSRDAQGLASSEHEIAADRVELGKVRHADHTPVRRIHQPARSRKPLILRPQIAHHKTPVATSRLSRSGRRKPAGVPGGK